MHTYLVVGSGGREHAIAWKLAQEPGARVVVAPGNPGIAADLGDDSCVAVPASDLAGLASLARELNADLTVVGPEAPLCAGIVDAFRAQGLPIFGPTQACAQLEASKHFAKVTMVSAGIPTAAYRTFVDVDHAIEYARRAEHPLVIKADGLAGGKGVTISTDVAQSVSTLRSYMSDGQFGQASQQVVIAEFLTGPELSFMVVCDGTRAVPLATSRDHKRLQTGDLGPNTGGMGASVPSPDQLPAL